MNKKHCVAILILLAFLVALQQQITCNVWFEIKDIHHETIIIALICLALGIIFSEK